MSGAALTIHGTKSVRLTLDSARRFLLKHALLVVAVDLVDAAVVTVAIMAFGFAAISAVLFAAGSFTVDVGRLDARYTPVACFCIGERWCEER